MVLQTVIHFSASWCIPSVAMNPIFEELALSFQDVLFLTVDVDDVKVKRKKHLTCPVPVQSTATRNPFCLS